MATWYRVTRWDNTPAPAEVVRETAKMLVFANGRKSIVQTNWYRWFPSEAEALANIAERKAQDDAADARQRARDAAPDLLEALQFYVAICGNTAAAVDRQSAQEAYERARAALAKAEAPQTPDLPPTKGQRL